MNFRCFIPVLRPPGGEIGATETFHPDYTIYGKLNGKLNIYGKL